jgi:hypothetical protein
MSDEYEMEYTREDELLERIAEQEELLNSTLEENKDIYKKMADLDTALEDCTESLTDARIKIKELEEENASIKTLIEEQHKVGNGEFWKSVWYIKRRNVELEEENKKWKDEWQEQVQKANDEGFARTLQTIQLTQAKEIIKLLLWDLRNRSYQPLKDIERAEQFLKESE